MEPSDGFRGKAEEKDNRGNISVLSRLILLLYPYYDDTEERHNNNNKEKKSKNMY